ncbi:MAG: metal-dependent hydrolase [Bacteroidetes bacterium]|nr:metal-dependent hydrolase [Bacteroidota bacterium]MBS1929524.1 metal-dependent hydrolase [Bacteroidota bacterium]
MDTLTHIALGACVGEVLLGKKLGKKALLIGAFANSIPDFDFVTAFWMSIDRSLLAHRGITHSFLFAVLIALLLSYLFFRWFNRLHISIKTWIIFFMMEIFLHLFIDAFNNYGVGWLEPFSNIRISFNTIFVIDPFYSVWPGVALVFLMILKKDHPKRKLWPEFGLGISSLYLMYCVVNKFKTDSDIRDMLKTQQISYTDYLTTPTPLNNWLWYIAAGDKNGYYIGYYSVFDRQKKIALHYYPKNDSLLNPVRDHKEVQRLIQFSRGFYTVEHWHDTLVFNDLRFEQIVGWYQPEIKNTLPSGRFAFHYFLQHKSGNDFVVQRGRFAGWNLETTKALIKRIEGN